MITGQGREESDAAALLNKKRTEICSLDFATWKLLVTFFYKNGVSWSNWSRSLLEMGLRENKEHLEIRN